LCYNVATTRSGSTQWYNVFVTTETKQKYRVTFDCGSEVLSGEGETVADALKTMKKPTKLVAKSFLTLTHGKRTASMLFMPAQAKRLFYPLSQLYIAKRLEHLLK